MPRPKRTRKPPRPVVAPLPESVSTGTPEAFPCIVDAPASAGIGGLDLAGLARLDIALPELFALASRMPMLDAQIRRGALLGIPRLTLLRANALVRYVRTGDPLPDYPRAIEPYSFD